MKSYVFPGDIDRDIMLAGSQPIPYMRTDEFSSLNIESERMLLDLIHCKKGRTIIYTGSGTGAMSAVIENYALTKQKAIVIDGGSFGHRWYDMCQYYGVPAIDFKVPFANDIDYKFLEETIIKEKPDLFLCQHHETSTGQLFNLNKISRICKLYNISLVVDVISSFLAEELDMDSLGIDICITSTQKGLNIPPGLSILFFSEKLDSYKFNRCGYYWDFEENFSNLKRGQTPYSPATSIFIQLNMRLHQIVNDGGENKNIQDVRHRSLFFKKLCSEYGWKIPAEVPSNAITGFIVNEPEPKYIFNKLREKYNTYIMPGSIPGFYRVSHMGLQSDDDLRLLAERIREFEV